MSILALASLSLKEKADVLSAMLPNDRAITLTAMSSDDCVAILSHLSPKQRAETLRVLNPDDMTELCSKMTKDQILVVLTGLAAAEAALVVAAVQHSERGALLVVMPRDQLRPILAALPTVNAAEAVSSNVLFVPDQRSCLFEQMRPAQRVAVLSKCPGNIVYRRQSQMCTTCCEPP